MVAYQGKLGLVVLMGLLGSLAGGEARGVSLSCEGGNGERVEVRRVNDLYQVTLEEINFHYDSLISKLGFAIDNERYEVAFSFSAELCRENSKYPYLLNCATSVPVGNQLRIRNLKSGQTFIRPLSQVGELGLVRQVSEMVNSAGEVSQYDELQMTFVGYSAEFPFGKGGLSRKLGLYFPSCHY